MWQRVSEDYAPFNINVTISEDILRGANDGYGYGFDFEAGLATTASHEAGHGFELEHQQQYDADGNRVLLDDYSDGTDTWSPIMGQTFDDDRTTWADGPVGSDNVDDQPNLFHDELAVLTRAANGFGYRPDDHGNTRLTASAFNYTLTGAASATGIIEKMDDDCRKPSVWPLWVLPGNVPTTVTFARVWSSNCSLRSRRVT